MNFLKKDDVQKVFQHMKVVSDNYFKWIEHEYTLFLQEHQF